MTIIGSPLPADYLRFMRSSNGAEGPIGKTEYLRLWSAKEVGELNEAYHVAEFAPGLLLFGGDGGDVGYAFDTRQPAFPIVEVNLLGMSLESARRFALTFEEFLKKLAKS